MTPRLRDAITHVPELALAAREDTTALGLKRVLRLIHKVEAFLRRVCVCSDARPPPHLLHPAPVLKFPLHFHPRAGRQANVGEAAGHFPGALQHSLGAKSGEARAARLFAPFRVVVVEYS